MFTGLVQACGCVASAEAKPFGMRLVVDRRSWTGFAPQIGDSVCVSGVCLTVVAYTDQTLSFDVISETLARTTLRRVQAGTRLNLEPSLMPTTPLGGHFVQGHVDGVAQIVKVKDVGEEYRLTIEPLRGDLSIPGDDLMEAIIPKGSVTVDGVSLTVASVDRSGFEVALIPVTLEQTTLGDLREGDQVNIETDIISKTVVHWLTQQVREGRKITLDTLHRAGFDE